MREIAIDEHLLKEIRTVQERIAEMFSVERMDTTIQAHLNALLSDPYQDAIAALIDSESVVSSHLEEALKATNIYSSIAKTIDYQLGAYQSAVDQLIKPSQSIDAIQKLVYPSTVSLFADARMPTALLKELALSELISSNLANLRTSEQLDRIIGETLDKNSGRPEDKPEKPQYSINTIIDAKEKTSEGALVASVQGLWFEILDDLLRDWDNAAKIPPDKWEEFIAGAFKRANYDEVVLTPRSGDFGRDVIAIKKGIGSVRVIGSVKAYSKGRNVSYDDVRALLGVLSGERNTSKGILMTTSGFPPLIMQDPFIAPFVPYRLELMDHNALRIWLKKLSSGG